MAKLVVVYETPKDQEGFEKYYFDTHVPLCDNMPGLKNTSFHKVKKSFNTDLNLYMLVELEFDTVADVNAALGSEAGGAVNADVKNLMEYLEKPPIISIVE